MTARNRLPSAETAKSPRTSKNGLGAEVSSFAPTSLTSIAFSLPSGEM